jgi:hypothetical protein
MGLGRETRHVAYPVPKILAARMGPTPKSWVRVVPEVLLPRLRCAYSGPRSFGPASLR